MNLNQPLQSQRQNQQHGLREAFENSCRTHAAADAHGYHAVARVAAFQFAQDCGGEFCAGAAQRMAQGDRAAVDVDAGGINSQTV